MRSVFIASHQPSLYMARLPIVSKYCCVRCSGAAPSVSDATNETPCMGSCSIPSTVSGAGMPAASRIVGATSITWVNGARSGTGAADAGGPVDDQRVAGPAEV